MTSTRIALVATLAAAGLLGGCAVYPAYPYTTYPTAPVGQVVTGQPGVVYAQPAPVIVAPPPPVYYGPAIYPSISIFGRFGGGHGHYHGRGWR